MFLNGTEVATSTNNIPGSYSAFEQYFGTWRQTLDRQPGREYNWQGKLDDVRIYNRALSAAEVQQLYSLGSTTPPAVTPASLSISAPATLRFSTSTPLTATVTYSDTTSKGVTPIWTSSNTAVASVSASGTLTAGSVTADTQVTITANYTENGQTVTASKTLAIIAATVANAPTIGTATAGNGQVTVSFTAPTDDGGTAITGYTVTASPGGLTASGNASPLTVTGLTNGTAYTFTVTATNSAGVGAASSASVAVTPAAPMVSGICGSAHNTARASAPTSGLCQQGTAGALSGSGPWAWSCTGSGGGSTAQCAATMSTNPNPSIALPAGWNLLGNGVEATIDVAQTFGDSSKFLTVWKWVTSGNSVGQSYPAWAFYTPSQADGGKAYALSKGYDWLTDIQAGEGFWVNAKQAFDFALPAGTLIASTSFLPEGGTRALGSGWRLMATGDHPTPSAFNNSLSLVPPSPGVTATNLTSLWAWDPAVNGWYFWAPSLVSSGTLATYLTTKGYLDVTTLPSTPPGNLLPTTGFWVNR